MIYAQLRKRFSDREFIGPSCGMVSFAKSLNRSITGSINDHLHATKLTLAHEMAPGEIGYLRDRTSLSDTALECVTTVTAIVDKPENTYWVRVDHRAKC